MNSDHTSGEALLRDAVSHGDGFRNAQECEEACRWAHDEVERLREALRRLTENESGDKDWECVRASDLDHARALLSGASDEDQA